MSTGEPTPRSRAQYSAPIRNNVMCSYIRENVIPNLLVMAGVSIFFFGMYAVNSNSKKRTQLRKTQETQVQTLEQENQMLKAQVWVCEQEKGGW